MMKKVTVELPEDVYEALTEIADNADDRANALARAILTKKYIKEHGDKFFVEKDGDLHEVEIIDKTA